MRTLKKTCAANLLSFFIFFFSAVVSFLFSAVLSQNFKNEERIYTCSLVIRTKCTCNTDWTKLASTGTRQGSTWGNSRLVQKWQLNTTTRLLCLERADVCRPPEKKEKRKKKAQVKTALFQHSSRNSARKYCLQDVKMAERHCSTFTNYRSFPDPRGRGSGVLAWWSSVLAPSRSAVVC